MTDPIWALGTMSGTSLDGVDAALVLTNGEVIEEFGAASYRPYTEIERATIRSALGQWPGGAGVGAAAQVVENAHIELLKGFAHADIIGFHGQTLAHDPDRAGTHQTGDGARLARALNCPVVWDFRSADVAMGGQGAPLAPFFHFALAKYIGAAAPVAFLNLGGISNLTWVDPSHARPDADGALLAFDTGPANASIDDLMQTLGQPYDNNGAMAAAGTANPVLIARALQESWFTTPPPKSMDRAEAAGLLSLVADLPTTDAAATLVAIAARAVGHGIRQCPAPPARVLVSGGGRHNETLMRAITDHCDMPVAPVEEVGLDGDMLEAQAFAHLAVRVRKGPANLRTRHNRRRRRHRWRHAQHPKLTLIIFP